MNIFYLTNYSIINLIIISLYIQNKYILLFGIQAATFNLL